LAILEDIVAVNSSTLFPDQLDKLPRLISMMKDILGTLKQNLCANENSKEGPPDLQRIS